MTEKIRTTFSLFFTNVNSQMNLGGHSHFAHLTLTWLTIGYQGFPAFEDTYRYIQNQIKGATEKPFRDCTNEEVCRRLFHLFKEIDYRTVPEFSKWDMCKFELVAAELAVRGVPDRLGHADSFTYYTVEADNVYNQKNL